MTNPLRGEVEAELGGEIWRLRLTLNAMCEIEERMGKGFMEIVSDLENGRTGGFKGMRTILCAAARHHRKDVTPEQIGELIAAADMKDLGALITKLMSVGAPEPGGEENPPAAAAG